MPINQHEIDNVRSEIRRLEYALDILTGDENWRPRGLVVGTAASGAVRRASMDLTRALADLRRSPGRE